jgi:predicted AAA+ superfamily ATPase
MHNILIAIVRPIGAWPARAEPPGARQLTSITTGLYRDLEGVTVEDTERENFVGRVEGLLAHLEGLFTRSEAEETPDFAAHAAFRYHTRNGRGSFEPVRHVDPIRPNELIGVERQWDAFNRNTRQLLRRLPCNHVLLWGARGTGKSSMVKAALNRYAPDGLRLIEIRRSGLLDLATIVDGLADAPFAFLVLLDDLSFEDNDPLARELKALLEGGIQQMPDNVRVVATANRRHLMPKRAGDNAWADEDDLHVRDAAEEKASLADRFGLRLGFPTPDQPWFLEVVDALSARHGLSKYGPEIRRDALAWSRSHGLSGRSARQFMDDWAGNRMLDDSA